MKLLFQVVIGSRPHHEYSMKTWEWWSKKHGFEYVIHSPEVAADEIPAWRKFDCKDLLEKYDCTVIVDDDTMVSWQCPDFTVGLGSAIAAAPDWGGMGTVAEYCRLGFEKFGGSFIDPWEYANTGLMVWPSNGRIAMEEVLNAGTPASGLADGDMEQTTVNYVARRHGFKLLSPRCNFSQPLLHRMFGVYQLPALGDVWHFNDAKGKNRLPLMENSWRLFQEKYV